MPYSYPRLDAQDGQADSFWEAALYAVKYRIQSLDMPGFPGDRIEVLKQPVDRGILQSVGRGEYGYDGNAAAAICPGDRERKGRRRNKARDILYPISVVLFRASNYDNINGLSAWLYWRELLAAEFDDFPFQEVTGGQRVEVDYGAMNPTATWLKGFDAQMLTLTVTQCISRA